MRLLALAGDIGAVIAQIRLVTPLTALCEQQGWTLVLRSFHDCSRHDLGRAGVLVVQRASSARVLRLEQRMRWLGGAVVYDIDDLLTDVSPHISIRAAAQWRASVLRQCMDEADVVTVSTARLGRELGLQQPIEVPNGAWPLPEQPLPALQPEQPVHLLFASSEHLATDFIYPAVRALKEVRVVVVGPPAAAFQRAGIAVQAEPLLPRDQFVALARSLPNVLAVIPLEDSRFAACKSAVKWFDYAAAGVPALCSAVSPYAEVVQDGVSGGLVVNTPQAWQAALQQAVDDPQWRQRVAAAAREQVRRQHALQQTVDAWHRAVQTAVQRRAAAARPAPGAAWHVRQALEAAFESAALRLRALNRARLARRLRR